MLRWIALVLALLAALPAAAEGRLMMIDDRGCPFCRAWDAQVGKSAYNGSAAGRSAPLYKVKYRSLDATGVTFRRPVQFTPTFVHVVGGREVGRIEGYRGAAAFWSSVNALVR